MLLQSILRKFCLNLSISWCEILCLRMYCSEISRSFLFFCSKGDSKKVGNICFHNSSLDFYIAQNSIYKCEINWRSSVPCNILFFIPELRDKLGILIFVILNFVILKVAKSICSQTKKLPGSNITGRVALGNFVFLKTRKSV